MWLKFAVGAMPNERQAGDGRMNGYQASARSSAELGEGPVQPRIDARGWIGIAVFILTIMVLWMIAAFPELRKDDFFKVLATAIVLTGFIQGVVGWAYTATKQGGELAQKAADIVQQSATANADATLNGSGGAPAADTEAVRLAINDALENAVLTDEQRAEEIAGRSMLT